MKILFVTNLYPTDNNPDYGVFTKEQIDNILLSDHSGDIIYINAREKGIIEYLNAAKKIKTAHINYDLIHCFHGLSLIITFFSSSKTPILISFLNEIKFESFKKNKLINFIYTITYKLLIKSNRISTIFKDKIPQHLLKNKNSFYLPNGIDLSCFYPINREISCTYLNLDPKKTYILFVSSKDKLRPQKRYDVFSEAIGILKENAKELNIEELILTNVPRDYCIHYFNAASLHLLTSDYEGSPNSVKEAMSCNTPVVSTDVGNVKQMIGGASNCYITEQDPKSLANYALKALTAPPCDLRNILIKNKLTVQDKTEELIEIYKKITGDKIDFKT